MILADIDYFKFFEYNKLEQIYMNKKSIEYSYF